ncbi:MAG: LLM class F420-dependent oxidoreductase [Kutzneria sp.]|nr:LLM class F420-dependent oxidoreductase [Kutzneria sp.]
MRLGRVGIWNIAIGSAEPSDQSLVREAAAELDELGYGAIWIGGSPALDRAGALLGATARITVATGILNIWSHAAVDVAAGHAAIAADHPGRLVLGLGASHAALVKDYRRPLSFMRDYLDGLDAAGQPAAERVLAALGPKMLELARDRAAGAHPYLVTAEHTARAREVLGRDALLAPEVKVVLDGDRHTARAIARTHLAMYLALPNYLKSLRTLGFTDDDFADGGSDRLVDATFAMGDEQAARTRLRQHFDAGADHVCVQVVTEEGQRSAFPREQWRRLAPLANEV